ncbi:protein jagunal-like isoform X2 [Watersipora subatra]|uniref:protein jagunal-like isoform X2 n=1 Tax=Watersipora subatra TaxID=2589382 RepID=UPI00355BCB27
MTSSIDHCLKAFEIISLNKGRLKVTVIFHWLLFLMMLLRLTPDLCAMVKTEVPVIIESLSLPPPSLWELSWLPSIMASMFAQLSLKRNTSSLLWQALLGNLVLSIGPVLYGLSEQYPIVREHLRDGKDSEISLSFLFRIATCCWLTVSLQVHVLQMYFIQQLLSAWSIAKRKIKSS